MLNKCVYKIDNAHTCFLSSSGEGIYSYCPCRDQPTFNASTLSIYLFLASLKLSPLQLFQASHLALATNSNNPGFGLLMSPMVACLKRP